jgi:hypothetical protein
MRTCSNQEILRETLSADNLFFKAAKNQRGIMAAKTERI